MLLQPGWICALTAGLLLTTPARAQSSQLGTVAFPTSALPAARPWFLKGVALLHSFEYEDAAEAFRRAQRIDPTFALAYWGEALTYDHPLWGEQDSVAARAVLQRLREISRVRGPTKALTTRESAYVAAAEALYGKGDKPARAKAYADAMRTVHEAYPSDAEAAAFYALALLGARPTRSTDLRLRVAAAAVAEAVFQKNPQHPGAAHYLIHAYDEPQLAPLGLRAALTYAGIAPAAEHAIHMPSHIFLQLGMWDEVVTSNEKSFGASQAWARKKGYPASHYDFHSLLWLHYGYLQQGRHREARALEDSARAMLATEQDSMPMWARMGPALMRVQYAAEARQRDSSSPEQDRDPLAAWYGAGLAAAQAGDIAQLRAAEERTRAYIDSLGSTSKPIRISHLVLQAHLAKLQGRPEEAVSVLERAAVLQDSISAVGPPYGLPVREALGELLLARGEAQEAAEQFELALLRSPNRSAALLGRARCAVRLGDQAGATRYYSLALQNWRKADSGLAEVDEARAAVSVGK